MTLAVHRTRREVTGCWESRGGARFARSLPRGPSYERRTPPHSPVPTYRLTAPLSFYSGGVDCRWSVSPEVTA